MIAKWYYSVDGRAEGPVEEANIVELLKTGQLTLVDLVFKEGDDRWKTIGEVPVFKNSYIKTTLPPRPAAPDYDDDEGPEEKTIVDELPLDTSSSGKTPVDDLIDSGSDSNGDSNSDSDQDIRSEGHRSAGSRSPSSKAAPQTTNRAAVPSNTGSRIAPPSSPSVSSTSSSIRSNLQNSGPHRLTPPPVESAAQPVVSRKSFTFSKGPEITWVLLQKKIESGEEKFIQSGPFSMEDLQKMLATGKAKYQDYLWRPGYKRWARLGNQPEFDRRSRTRDSDPTPDIVPTPLADVRDSKLEAAQSGLHRDPFEGTKLDSSFRSKLTPDPLEGRTPSASSSIRSSETPANESKKNLSAQKAVPGVQRSSPPPQIAEDDEATNLPGTSANPLDNIARLNRIEPPPVSTGRFELNRFGRAPEPPPPDADGNDLTDESTRTGMEEKSSTKPPPIEPPISRFSPPPLSNTENKTSTHLPPPLQKNIRTNIQENIQANIRTNISTNLSSNTSANTALNTSVTATDTSSSSRVTNLPPNDRSNDRANFKLDASEHDQDSNRDNDEELRTVVYQPEQKTVVYSADGKTMVYAGESKASPAEVPPLAGAASLPPTVLRTGAADLTSTKSGSQSIVITEEVESDKSSQPRSKSRRIGVISAGVAAAMVLALISLYLFKQPNSQNGWREIIDQVLPFSGEGTDSGLGNGENAGPADDATNVAPPSADAAPAPVAPPPPAVSPVANNAPETQDPGAANPNLPPQAGEPAYAPPGVSPQAANNVPEKSQEKLKPVVPGTGRTTVVDIVPIRTDVTRPLFAVQTNAPVGEMIWFSVRGRSGEILRLPSFTAAISVARGDSEVPTFDLGNLKLPTGNYQIEVAVGGVRKARSIFLGTKSAEFSKDLERHLKQISYQQQTEKRSLFHSARKLENLAKTLGEQYLRNKKEAGRWKSFYSTWQKDLKKSRSVFVDRVNVDRRNELAYPDEILALKTAAKKLDEQATALNDSIYANTQARDVAGGGNLAIVKEFTRLRILVSGLSSRR